MKEPEEDQTQISWSSPFFASQGASPNQTKSPPSMPLPDQMAASIVKALTDENLLSNAVATDLVKQLESGKPVTWNLLLNKQLEQEKGAADETDP